MSNVYPFYETFLMNKIETKEMVMGVCGQRRLRGMERFLLTTMLHYNICGIAQRLMVHTRPT